MKRPEVSRRDLLIAVPLLASGCVSGCVLGGRAADTFRRIEEDLGGRIGVSVVNTKSQRRAAYRGDERFALCSTFKAPLAAAVLAQIDAGTISGSATIDLAGEPLLSNSPISAEHAKEGKLPVMAACEAAVSHSDNTAANALLRLIGGPGAMTEFFRRLGDDTTRLDRYELALNSNLTGDVRDTTTPDAMVFSLQRIMLGDALSTASRALIMRWMANEQRGKARIRAGLPSTWQVANKPGTSVNGATNDIAVAWNPDGHPLVIAVYVNAPSATIAEREAAIAQVARAGAEQVT